MLSFTPEILDHEGVCFATTNNMYPAARQGEGLVGFEALFADEVAGKYGRIGRREDGFPPQLPTDPQAEVLYPRELSTEYLQRIYVSDVVSRRTIRAQCEAVGHPEVEIVVRADFFE